MNQKHSKYTVYILGFLVSFFWSSSYPITKIAQVHFTVNAVAFFRCAIASVILIVITIITKGKLPKVKDIPLFAVSGLLGFTLYLTFFNTGLQTLTAATSSIIVSINPILAATWASIFYKEKIKLKAWICIIGIFWGVVILVSWNGVFVFDNGIIWAILAALVFSIYSTLNGRLAKLNYTAIEIACYTIIFGALFLGMHAKDSLFQVINAPADSLFALLYLSIFPSAVAYFFFGKAFSLAKNTSTVTNFIFLNPFISSILGFLLLDEIPNAGFFIGGSIIIVGLFLFNYFESKTS